MTRIISTTLALLTVTVFSGQVMAADMDYPASPDFTPVEFGSGWYLRGDVGYNIGGEQKSGSTYIPAYDQVLVYQYDDAISLRGAVGFRVNPWLRLEGGVESLMASSFDNTVSRGFAGTRDVAIQVETAPGSGIFNTYNDTVEFDAHNNVVGSTTGAYQTYIGNTASSINGSEKIEASYQANLIMANAYVDLPTMGKFTPYVGAGIGGAQVTYKDKRTWTCSASTDETCLVPSGAMGTEVADYVGVDVDDTFWTTAWQINAGTGYKLSQNLSLDVGWTYTQVGTGKAINYADGRGMDIDGASFHQIKAGLRYEIW